MKFHDHFISLILLFIVMMICLCLGSVDIPPAELWASFQALFQGQGTESQYGTILFNIRLPRILATSLVGGSLSLAGLIMQGLLKNPLADGSTLGISSGASLGAAFAILFGLNFGQLPLSATALMASLFSFLSMLVILSLAHQLDRSLSNHSVILMGIIFSMFASAMTSLLMVAFREKLDRLIFWTMGSLASSSYQSVFLLVATLLVFGSLALTQMRELNAFSIGEDQARHLGVSIKRVRLLLYVCVSFLIGHAVSVSGQIAFVGLIVPHMARGLWGPNFQTLMPASLYLGAIFLLLADLVARSLFAPLEIPIGVVTSIIGSIFLIVILIRQRRAG